MGKIARAMPDWLKYDRGSAGQDALKYIETGDPAALGRVKPSGKYVVAMDIPSPGRDGGPRRDG